MQYLLAFIVLGLSQTMSSLADANVWECKICEVVVQAGLGALENNSTTVAIIEQIDIACAKILPNNTATCEEVADGMVFDVIGLLEENVKPSAVCTDLGYC